MVETRPLSPLPLKIIFLLAFSLTVSGCFGPTCWTFREVISDCPQFNSAQLKSVRNSAFSGIEMEFLRGEFGLIGYLNVCCREISSNEVKVYIDEKLHTFTGLRLQGNQKMLLPHEMVNGVAQALLNGQSVTIALEGFTTTLGERDFAKKYAKLTEH